jgi:hypothetical protein
MPIRLPSLILLASLAQPALADSDPLTGSRLQDFRGATFAFDAVGKGKLVVLAFVGVDCLLANRYAPRLVELKRSFEPKGVAFFAIDSNQQDGAAAMGRFCDRERPVVSVLEGCLQRAG